MNRLVRFSAVTFFIIRQYNAIFVKQSTKTSITLYTSSVHLLDDRSVIKSIVMCCYNFSAPLKD